MQPGGRPRKARRMINNRTAEKEAMSHTRRGYPCGASIEGYAELGIGSLTLQSNQKKLPLGPLLIPTLGTNRTLEALGTAAAVAIALTYATIAISHTIKKLSSAPPRLALSRSGAEQKTEGDRSAKAKTYGDDWFGDWERRSRS